MSMKKNEILEVTVKGYTHEGLGVAKIDGIPIFIDGALDGEIIKVKIIKVKKSYLIGKLIEIIKRSESRVDPFCEHYKKCGGCSLQHMNYNEQKKFKHDVVLNNIRKIGKIDDIKVNETIGMEDSIAYRNKAQYPVGQGEKGIITGFYEKRTHKIVNIECCGIQENGIDDLKNAVKEVLNNHEVSAYEEVKKKGLLKHIVIRKGRNTGQFMVVIVVNGKKLPNSSEVIRDICELVNVESVVLNINTEHNNVIMGKRSINLHGSDYIKDTIGEFEFKISATSFFQVNTVQAKVLYDTVSEYGEFKGSETVFDLYCGTGTIGIYISKLVSKVYGIEVVEQAVSDANENLKLNGVSNVEFMRGKAEEVVPDLYKKGVNADVVVVDPPRQGCDGKLLDTIISMMPEKIIYVSCNSATLARDLNILCENGFEVCKVQPLDMFPCTYHVECVVKIQRKK